MKRQNLHILITAFMFIFFLTFTTRTLIEFNGAVSIPDENTYKLKSSAIINSNATIISDGYNNTYWNDKNSEDPVVAIDQDGIIHSVWHDGTNGIWGTDYEIFHAMYSPGLGWSNITVISDGYDGIYWNDGKNSDPAIAIDSTNKVHVVYEDNTEGIWGTDYEIMYVSYTSDSGWSNATVISDGYNGFYWNDDWSYKPSIAIDSNDNIHVVWYDYTDGPWGSDTEIFHVQYSSDSGWSNATLISDGYMGTYWNEGGSSYPKIAIDDNDNLHVVWQDETDGAWGIDREIMYAEYNVSSGWTNATVISDGYNGVYWNDDYSNNPVISCYNDQIYVVWEDGTNGVWGTDYEIFYVNYTPSSDWSNVTIISDGYMGNYWNNEYSFNPDLIADYNGVIHVVWEDGTDGFWGIDTEILYVNYTLNSGWTNVSVLSDGYSGVYWNDGLSRYPSICVGVGNIYIVWQDGTDGVWGTDYEIMFSSFTIPPPISPRGAIPFSNLVILTLIVTIAGLAFYTKRKL
jgi:hypothetical protein